MAIANNHAERVAGLSNMAQAECDGDSVAAFAALCDAAAIQASVGGVYPHHAIKRMEQAFANMIHDVKQKSDD